MNWEICFVWKQGEFDQKTVDINLRWPIDTEKENENP